MTEAAFLARGAAIGFAVAAPVGAIGLLCIRRTLAEGPRAGLAAGLGAATADALYGAVAAFGLSGLAALLVGAQGWVRLVGGAALVWLGVRAWRSAPAAADPAPAPDRRGLAAAYATTFALTLANPGTILSFAAIFAGVGLAEAGGDAAAALLLTLGVFLGSAAWWLLLAGGVARLRGALTPARLAWVNRLSGAAIALFGLAALASALPG